MSFRLYDVLEETLNSLDQWKSNDSFSKTDVIDGMKERILTLMTHVITTPLIGTSFAYPGDIPHFEKWVETGAIP